MDDTQEVMDDIRGLVEAEAAQLLALARELEKRSAKDGEPGQTEISRRAYKGLQMLAGMKISPPPDLLVLIAYPLGLSTDELGELTNDRDLPTDMPSKFERAVKWEARAEPDPTGVNPSMASVSSTAREAGVANKTIRDWRGTQRYRDEIDLNRAARRIDMGK